MATFYSKERAKYGNLTGQIIIWPVQYDGTPSDGANPINLPAGYLKCDGSRYFAKDYPRLASILGTGQQSKFLRRNIDGTALDQITDEQFAVPDLGSKYPEPTSGANAGVYNNIRLNNPLGNEISRSGIGIEAVSAIGNDVRITYSGDISVPSQEIPIRGRPSYTYAGASHYTDIEGVEENSIHPHAHFHSAVRARNMALTEVSSSAPRAAGQTGRRNASTINVQDWLDATVNSSGIPGSGQQPCLAIDQWNPNAGTPFSGQPVWGNGAFQTLYYGGCIFGYGEQYNYNCLTNQSFTVNRATLDGSANQSNTARFVSQGRILVCLPPEEGAATQDSNNDVPATYIQGSAPIDFLGNSLYDVLPLQSNQNVLTAVCTPDIENVATDTSDLEISAGADPTRHNHRIDLETTEHTYKVKTRAINIPPENLVTTMSIGVDSSVSVDSACAPFIVMEYLIKI
jgi:hypothetical protein